MAGDEQGRATSVKASRSANDKFGIGRALFHMYGSPAVRVGDALRAHDLLDMLSSCSYKRQVDVSHVQGRVLSR
jgi:hypothetical protein